MTRSYYFVEITNEYLGNYRRITGRSRREVELKTSEQLQRWDAQEARARVRAAVSDAKEQARLDTEAARTAVEEHRSILAATLGVDDRLNWDGMLDEAELDLEEPTLAAVSGELGIPQPRRFVEWLSKKVLSARLDAERAAEETWTERRRDYEQRVAEHKRVGAEQRAGVEAFRREYDAGEPDAVERYVSLILAQSVFPSTFSRECKVAYTADDGVVVVEVPLPTPVVVPQVVEYRYVASRDVIDEKRMKEKSLLSCTTTSSYRPSFAPCTRSSRATTAAVAASRSLMERSRQ